MGLKVETHLRVSQRGARRAVLMILAAPFLPSSSDLELMMLTMSPSSSPISLHAVARDCDCAQTVSANSGWLHRKSITIYSEWYSYSHSHK